MKKVINHCKTQGICNKINIDFKNKIEDHVTQYKTFLEENQITDQPFTISEVKSLKLTKVQDQILFQMKYLYIVQ